MEIIDSRSKEEAISMEILDRQNEEESYLWIPFQFIDQTFIALFKFLGLLSPDTSNQPEEEYVAVGDDDVVVLPTTTSRKANSSGKGNENPSTGRPGQTHKVPTEIEGSIDNNIVDLLDPIL